MYSAEEMLRLIHRDARAHGVDRVDLVRPYRLDDRAAGKLAVEVRARRGEGRWPTTWVGTVARPYEFGLYRLWLRLCQGDFSR